MKKLAIITTHPIQYNAPLFQLLAKGNKIKLKVFYTWSQSADGNIFDPGFGIKKQWDIPLLQGYEYSFVENISKQPGSHHYKGIINPSIIKEVKDFAPDALMVYGWSFNAHLKVLRYFKNKIPVYFRGDSTLLNEPPGFSLKKIARRSFLRWVYRHIDHAFYAGANNKAYFKKHGLKESQLLFLPHAIDNGRFSTKTEKNIFRQAFNIPATHYILLYAGKLEPVKNTTLLLEAFMRLNRSDVHLVVVGSGPLEAEMKTKAKNSDNIHFMPFVNQSEMPAVYQSADVFILPSKSETWGLAVNEAMASGLPVIVSNRCGCAPDLVQQGINGFIFQSGNVNDLSTVLSNIFQHPHKLAAFGNASANIISQWSFKNCAEIIENELKR